MQIMCQYELREFSNVLGVNLPLLSPFLQNFSRKSDVRIPPEIHRKLAIEAEEEGISLNRLVSAKLSR